MIIGEVDERPDLIVVDRVAREAAIDLLAQLDPRETSLLFQAARDLLALSQASLEVLAIEGVGDALDLGEGPRSEDRPLLDHHGHGDQRRAPEGLGELVLDVDEGWSGKRSQALAPIRTDGPGSFQPSAESAALALG
jgi:hypothetical protein